MAYASRFLSRSKQLQGSMVILQQHQAIPVRAFAKEAARPTFKGDEMLKGVFFDIKNKFQAAIDILRKEKITLDPEDPAAVKHYANVMKTIRQKADMFSESQRIKHDIDTETREIPDARAYLLKLQEIRTRRGLTDELGAEAMMLEALEKVEKDIKKPLLRSDKKGMDLLISEFEKGNKKLGIRKEDLPKYEETMELSIAKAQLDELKSDALEAMEAQKKKEEFQNEEMPDVKSLDIRNFI